MHLFVIKLNFIMFWGFQGPMTYSEAKLEEALPFMSVMLHILCFISSIFPIVTKILLRMKLLLLPILLKNFRHLLWARIGTQVCCKAHVHFNPSPEDDQRHSMPTDETRFKDTIQKPLTQSTIKIKNIQDILNYHVYPPQKNKQLKKLKIES